MNEKRVLSYLIKQGNTSNTTIAKELGLTSQGVGKIRKKLEQRGLIKHYTIQPDYQRIGIKIITGVIVTSKSKRDQEQTHTTIQQLIASTQTIISAYKIQSGKKYLLLFGSRDFDEQNKVIETIERNLCIEANYPIVPKDILRHEWTGACLSGAMQ